jgi:hypothetical protein
MEKEIVFVSGHYPKSTYFASITKLSIEKYTSMHGYNFYYNEDEPEDTAIHILHFHRCKILQNAYLKFPHAKWFVWLDSDIFITNYHMRVEDQLNLRDENILYHLFHENNWGGGYPINTGVKFVNRNALNYEKIVWDLRNTHPWNTFPCEQKTIYEYVLPQIPNQYIIHDPYVLNCIMAAYPDKIDNALFIHMCSYTQEQRNETIKNYIEKIL